MRVEESKAVGWTAALFKLVVPDVDHRRRYLRDLGVSPTLFDQPDNRMSTTIDEAVWEIMSASASAAEIVTLAAQELGVSALGLGGFLCMAAPSVGDALRLHFKYRLLQSDRDMVLEEFDDGVLLGHCTPYPARSVKVEAVFATCAQVVRAWTEAPVMPALITFRHRRPEDATYLEQILGAELRFEATRDAIAFSGDDCARPLKTANMELRRYLEGIARRQVGEHTSAVTERVWAELYGWDGDLRAELAQIAKGMGMSSRTLQRRLAEEGLRFQDVVDDVARSRAVELLDKRELTVSEVATRLGFQEARAFSRAFRRWTGLSPSHWRRR